MKILAFTNPSGIIIKASKNLAVQLITCIISGNAIKLRGFVGETEENRER